MTVVKSREVYHRLWPMCRPGSPTPVRRPRRGPAPVIGPRSGTDLDRGRRRHRLDERVAADDGISTPAASAMIVGASSLAFDQVALTTRPSRKTSGFALPEGRDVRPGVTRSIFVSIRNFWNRTMTFSTATWLMVRRVDLLLAVDRARYRSLARSNSVGDHVRVVRDPDRLRRRAILDRARIDEWAAMVRRVERGGAPRRSATAAASWCSCRRCGASCATDSMECSRHRRLGRRRW